MQKKVLDPGVPIDLQPSHFWVWVEMVRLTHQEGRGSELLSSRDDCHPIISHYYTPREGTKTGPNPSVYLSNMKDAGVIDKINQVGNDFFWKVDTEVVIRVGGEIIYIPSDLQALLDREERFLVPRERADDGESMSLPGVEEEDEQMQAEESPDPLDPLVDPSNPSNLYGNLFLAYEELLRKSRQEGHRAFQTSELNEVFMEVGYEGRGELYKLRERGYLAHVGGELRSRKNPPMYRVIFRPYYKTKDELRVPPECEGVELDESSVLPETVLEKPVVDNGVAESDQGEFTLTDLAQLDEAELRRLLTERQNVLEDQRSQVQTELRGCSDRAQELTEQIRALQSELDQTNSRQSELERKFRQLQDAAAADQLTNDIEWLLENRERIGRLGDLMQALSELRN